MQLPLTTRLYHFVRGPNPLHPRVWNGRLSPLKFRRFETADLPRCMELYMLNEPGRFPAGVSEDYKRCLTEQKAFFLVAEKEGRIVGSGGVHCFLRRDLAILCFGLVHPEYQGAGIGAALLLARLALLDPEEPVYHVLIAAVEKSIGYYHRFGFERVLPWRDKHGQEHPSGHLVLTAYEIRQCRGLLARHNISMPTGENLVPLRKNTESDDNQSSSNPKLDRCS